MTGYFEPRSLHEACELADRYQGDGKILAGGTALVLFMRQGLLDPAQLINVQHVPELRGVAVEDGADGGGRVLAIGAAVTHAEAARLPVVRQVHGALAETFRKVATPRIRNVGTVGGNLANGDPHQDPPVTLLALDAWVTAVSTRGRREIRLGEFFRSYYETALRPDEILTRVSVPTRPARAGLAFIKYLPRSQDDYATVDVAAWVRLADGSSSGPAPELQEVRIALGSVGPVPFRALDAERILTGGVLTERVLAESGAAAAAACDPEDDVRGSAAYKRELVKVLVGRAVRQAVEDAEG